MATGGRKTVGQGRVTVEPLSIEPQTFEALSVEPTVGRWPLGVGRWALSVERWPLIVGR